MGGKNPTQKWCTNRRKYLAGVSGAIVSFTGVSYAASSSDNIEIPITMSGDVVLRTKKVPKDWWNHVMKSRKVRERLQYDYADEKGVGSIRTAIGNDEINGRRKMKIRVEIEDGISRTDIPGEIDGIRIEKVEAKKLEPTICENYDSFDIVPGGVTFGNVNSNGTSGCRVFRDQEYYMLTANHLFVDFSCGNPDGLASNQHPDQSFGEATDIYSEAYDYVAVEKSNGGLILGSTIEHDGRRYEIGGRATNYEDMMEDETPVYKTGIATGYTEGVITGVGDSGGTGCIDLSGVGLEYSNNQAEGDSGAAPFKVETYDGVDYAIITGLATLGRDESGWIRCWWDDDDVERTNYHHAVGVSSDFIHEDAGLHFT